MGRREKIAAGAAVAILAVAAGTFVFVAGGNDEEKGDPVASSGTSTTADSTTTTTMLTSDEQLDRFSTAPLCPIEDEPLPPDPNVGDVAIGAFVRAGDCIATVYETVSEEEAATRLAEIEADPDTVSAMVDQVAFTDDVQAPSPTPGPSSAYGSRGQWALDRLGIEEAWRWTRGDGVRVGIVDTPPDAAHEDLAANVVVDHPRGDVSATHGTHVAGIVAADDNGYGVTGIAPDADLITIGGLLPDLPTVVAGASGIRRAVDDGAQVINLSWYAPYDDTFGYGPLETTLRYAAARDVVVVMAAGNCGQAIEATTVCPEGISTVYTPQRWVFDEAPWATGMLTVGSTTEGDRLSPFSSYTREPSLAAPGSDIVSTVNDNGYEPKSGTSMASPAVAGVAALVRAAAPDLTAPEVAVLLMDTAEPLDDVVPGSAGAGLVAPAAALRQAVGPAPITDAYLANMVIPGEICQGLNLSDEPRQLVDGAWEGQAIDGPDVAIYTGPTAVGDLDGDGVADGAFAVMCANGVADHTDILYVVRAVDGELVDVVLASYDESLDPFDYAQESLADIWGVRIDGGELVVDMGWVFGRDPLCCPTSKATSRHRLNGGGFDRVALTIVSDATRTAALAAAISAGDRAAVDAMLVPAARGSFDFHIDEGHTFSDGGCFEDFGIDRFCEITSSSGPTYIVTWVYETTTDEPLASLEILENH